MQTGEANSLAVADFFFFSCTPRGISVLVLLHTSGALRSKFSGCPQVLCISSYSGVVSEWMSQITLCQNEIRSAPEAYRSAPTSNGLLAFNTRLEFVNMRFSALEVLLCEFSLC